MTDATIAEVQTLEAQPAETLPKRTAKRIQELLEQIKSLKRDLEDARQPKPVPVELVGNGMEQVRTAHPDVDIAVQVGMGEIDNSVFPALLAVNPEAAYRYAVGCAAVAQIAKDQAMKAKNVELVEHYRHLSQEHFREVKTDA